MKDTEMRGMILNGYYEKRRSQRPDLGFDDFALPIDKDDFLRVSEQLAEHGMLDWHPLRGNKNQRIDGCGSITALGVDVIESDGEDSPIRMEFPVTQNIHISHSQGIQVGNHNTQNLVSALEGLIQEIEASDSSSAEKAEAKGRLRTFLQHSLTAAIVGPAATKLLDLLENLASS